MFFLLYISDILNQYKSNLLVKGHNFALLIFIGNITGLQDNENSNVVV